MLPGPRLALAAALLAAVGTAPAAGGSPGVAAVDSATFVDERAEQPGSPDISTVVVSNDDAGRITFRVDTPNRRRLTQDMRVRIGFTARGKEYFLLVDPFKPAGVRVGLYRCEPGAGGVTTCSTLPGAPSLTFRYVRGARLGFDATELGIDSAVRQRVPIVFWAMVSAGIRYDPATGYDLDGVRLDRAPSTGSRTWRYVAVFGA